MSEKIQIVPDDDDKGDDEIVEEPVDEYHIVKGYGGENPQSDMSFKPLFSYRHIDLGTTDFHFHRKDFTAEDAQSYFQKLKDFTKLKLVDLVNNNLYFKLSDNPNSNEFSLVQRLLGIETITDENRPVLGHFRLAHKQFDVDKYKKGEKQRAPRVFFLLDTQSRIHILLYDPFHEIHPMGKSTLASLIKQAEEEKKELEKELQQEEKEEESKNKKED